ncbi:MAG: peptidylprolyl isomerase, partial [Gammaproteobacteria bacterium]|nr:peptidylprolyl isomerase [Gammaproteobacteria bacterium]
ISKLSQKVPAERALQEIINVELLVQAAKNEGLMKNDELVLEIKRSTSGLIATHYLQQQLLKLEVTIEDLKARYNKDYVEANQAKEYNANHILVKTEEEATDIIQKLDGGAVFTELAKTLSTGPSGKSGGALGWFKSSDMVPPFSAATMKLELKQYTKQPVKSQFGWHIIYLNDTRATEPPAFESVSKELSSKIAGEEISKIMQQLHESATIVFPDK